jgi:hypothetical protein
VIERFAAVDHVWIDADWYGDAPHDPSSDTFGTEWVRQVGHWFPRAGAYPDGLRPVDGGARRELADARVEVEIPDAPGSALYVYRRLPA